MPIIPGQSTPTGTACDPAIPHKHWFFRAAELLLKGQQPDKVGTYLRGMDTASQLKQLAAWEQENWLELERWARHFRQNCLPAGGSARPYATKVVAAVDSIATDAANADYVCDGVADHVEIQAAIDELDTAGTGGTVLLLEGHFYCASGVTATVLIPSSVMVRGLGLGTNVLFDDGTLVGIRNVGELRDIYVTIGTLGGGGGGVE
jgi:hypothetical protein